ncbi:MAG: S8 family serine peptidase, partial [Euryarchaeota archaeon]
STGTSDSTALVSGLLALILESEPHLKNKNIDCVHEVKYALMNSTLSEDGVIFHDQKSGYGVINGMKWLNEIQDSVTC